MPNADQQYWDAHRTGERDDEQWLPLPTTESIYRGKCPDGDRCLHGCHRSEACYYVASSPGEREYASWQPLGMASPAGTRQLRARITNLRSALWAIETNMDDADVLRKMAHDALEEDDCGR